MSANDTTIEMMYFGSFLSVAGHSREADFWLHRQQLHIVPDLMRLESVRIAFKAYLLVRQAGLVLTPENIAKMALKEGMVEGDPSIIFENMKTELTRWAALGAKTRTEFTTYERTMQVLVLRSGLNDLPSEINRLLADPVGSPIEKLAKVQQLVSRLNSVDTKQATLMGPDEQRKSSESFVAKRRQDIADKKIRMTVPPQWGRLFNAMKQINPGEIAIIGGDTGGGKSIMSWQWFDWLCACGFPGLGIHLENSSDEIFARRAARGLPNTTDAEIEAGDPQNKLAAMNKIVDEWTSRGGRPEYQYASGWSPDRILNFIKVRLADTAHPVSHICIDYFQKALDNLFSDQNTAQAAGQFAEQIKNIAEQYNVFIIIVSQETTNADGTKHTMWSNALQQKAQLYFSLTRPRLTQNEVVNLENDPDPVFLATTGELSIWGTVKTIKSNRNPPANVDLIIHGPQKMAVAPEYQFAMERDPNYAFQLPTFRMADEKFYAMQARQLAAYVAAHHQLTAPTEARTNKAGNRK